MRDETHFRWPGRYAMERRGGRLTLSVEAETPSGHRVFACEIAPRIGYLFLMARRRTELLYAIACAMAAEGELDQPGFDALVARLAEAPEAEIVALADARDGEGAVTAHLSALLGPPRPGRRAWFGQWGAGAQPARRAGMAPLAAAVLAILLALPPDIARAEAKTGATLDLSRILGLRNETAQLSDYRPEALRDVLIERGYRAKLGIDDVGDPKITSGSQGAGWVHYFYECDANGTCGSVQFWTWLEPRQKVTLESINDWNRVQRFAKGYLDAKGRVNFQMDVELLGGVPTDIFVASLKTWDSLLGDFMKHIDW